MGVFGVRRCPFQSFAPCGARWNANTADKEFAMSKKNSYMFTSKQHTQKGIMSTILGVISLVTLAYTIIMSYFKAGDVPLQYGAAAMLVMIFAFVGIILGLISKTERDKFYLFAYIGIVLNVLALAVISVILYAGAYA